MVRSFSEWLNFHLLLIEVRERIDEELADLMQDAWKADTREAWAKVHDRLNVIGEFEKADQIRDLFNSPQ